MGSTGDSTVPPGHWPGERAGGAVGANQLESTRASQWFRSASRRTAQISGLCCPRSAHAYEISALALIVSCLSLGLAGCATDSAGPVSSPRLVVTEKVAEAIPVAPAAPLPDAPGTSHRSAEAFASANAPWPPTWANVWLPLETWSKFNRLEKPVQFGSGSDASFLLQTTNGSFRFKLGSHAMEFNGLAFWLGFAPRLINGFPYVHSIDASKTLQPLLGAPQLWTATNRTIVIDAGHGGKDSGAKSCFNGDYEKFYALDWASRLAVLLRECGWNVVMTRTNDTYLTLLHRVAVADRVDADVFVSLHFNSGSENGTQAGVETYCLTPTGMPSSLLRGEDNPREAYPNNAFDERNFQLATLLHRATLQASGAADRGVGRARFMGVLRGQTRPAVLVEGGYLTNPEEAQKLATPAYRQALAEGIAQALQ